MGEFPLFVDLEQAPCLIVGAGKVALRKAEALLPCRPRLTVAAPQALPEFSLLAEAGMLTLVSRPVRPEDLEGQVLVIAATEDRERNRQIAALCRERRILVNVVNDQTACTCKFPAVIRRGPLTVGISTGGASPTAARYFKAHIEDALPGENADMAGILDFLARTRETVKERLPEPLRAQAFAELFDRCMALGRGLTDEELEARLEAARND